MKNSELFSRATLLASLLAFSASLGWSQLARPTPIPVPVFAPAATSVVPPSAAAPQLPAAAQQGPAAARPNAILPPSGNLSITPATVTNLSDLASILQNNAEPPRVNFVFPDATEITESHLIRGAAVAQALALRAGDRPLFFSYSRQPSPRLFNVMIGPVDSLGLYVPADIIQQTTNSLLYLQSYPGSGRLPMLVVSGASPSAVDDAILALGFSNQLLPQSNVAYIRGISLPDSPPFIRQVPLYPGSSFTFQDLNEMGTPLRLAKDGALALDLFMSAMVAAPTEAMFQIDLHFVLRQRAFSSSSGLSILVNGKTVTQLAPSDISSAATGGSAGVISIPLNEFLPGRNEVLFQPAGMTGQVASPDTFAIFGDSGIVFPRVDGEVALPNLRTTSRTLFPLIGQPDGSEISILVTTNDPETIQAAWTFLAKCAQISNTFLYNATVSFKNLNPKQHQIIVGPLETLPEEYRKGITNSWLQKTQQEAEITVVTPKEPERNLQYFLVKEVRRIWPEPTPTPKPAKGTTPKGASDADALTSGYLASVPNPATPGRWALILCAMDGITLEKRTTDLVLPALWSRLNGSAALWRSDPASMHLFLPGKEKAASENLADRDVQLPLGEKLSRNTWIILGTIVFVILIALTMVLLSQFDLEVGRRKRKL